MRTFVLTVMLVGGASIAQMWPSPSRLWWGVVTEVEPGKWIRVANEMSDPGGMRIHLNSRTRVDGDLRADAQVQILYASTGGGSVARHIIILPARSRR